jgi:hypothetical protein
MSTPPPDPTASTLHRINRLIVQVERAVASGHVDQVVDMARRAGVTGVQAAPSKSSFRCPYHGAPVAGPCGLTSCRYHVPFAPANACVLAYCHDHQVQRLSVDEIAFLYRERPDHVRVQTELAVRAIRAASMDADAQNDPAYARSFWQVESRAVCCACGSVTEISERIDVPDSPLAWCGPECREALPADVARIEWQFGRPVGVVLTWAVRRYPDVDLLARMLEVSDERLDELCRQARVRLPRRPIDLENSA